MLIDFIGNLEFFLWSHRVIMSVSANFLGY